MLFTLLLYIYLSIIYGPLINFISKIKSSNIKDYEKLLVYNMPNIEKYSKYIICILFLITICLLYYDNITFNQESKSSIIYIIVFIHIYLIYLFINETNIPNYIYKILEYSGFVISIFYLFQLIILLY